MGSCCTPAPAPGAEFPDSREGWQRKAIAAAWAVSVKQLTGSYATVASLPHDSELLNWLGYVPG